MTVTVYEPDAVPDTRILAPVDDPDNADGKAQAYCVAFDSPVTVTVPEPTAGQ